MKPAPMMRSLTHSLRDRLSTRDSSKFSAARNSLKSRLNGAWLKAPYRSLVLDAPDATMLMTIDGKVRYVNPSIASILGYAPEAIVKQSFIHYLAPGDVGRLLQFLQNAAHGEPRLELEIRAKHQDDSWRWLCITAARFRSEASAHPSIVLNLRDMSARKRADEALHERQVRLELLSEIAAGIKTRDSKGDVVARAVKRIGAAFPDLRVVYSTVNADGVQTVVYVAGPPGTPDVSGLSVDLGAAPAYLAALRGTEPIVVADFSVDARFAPLAEALMIGGTRAGIDVPLQHSDYLVGTLCFDSPVPRAWSEHEVATLTDVAAYLRVALAEVHANEGHRRMEEALRRNEARFRSLVQHNWDIILALSTHRIIEYASQSIENSLGYAPDDVLGLDLAAFLHWDDAKVLQTAIDGCLLNPAAHPMVETRIRHQDGTWRHVEAVATNLLDDLAVGAIVLNVRDITQRKEAEHALSYQAFHDQLTGLPNRALLADRLMHALKLSSRNGEPVTLLFIDLDRFKLINDSLGHEAGDELIAAAAARLRANLREVDTLARFGGDEFVAILEGVGDGEAAKTAARLLDAFRPSFSIAGYETTVSACIGIAANAPDRSAPADLLRAADVALYEAKRRGGGGWVSFEPGMDVSPQSRFVLETELRHAVVRGEFVLHYQPIIELATGNVVAMEALIRWRHPDRGLIAPAEFIRIADEIGLMAPIGAWVLSEACRELAELRERDPSCAPLAVSVNLSTPQLRDPHLVRHVTEALENAHLLGSDLILEVTEEVLMEDLRATIDALRQLSVLGIRLAIDDFGAGASSLAHIRELSAHVLKLDRSLILGVERDESSRAIVRAITGLAHAFGMSVVAEGIETTAQMEVVRQLGCDWAQGYHLSKPLAPANLSTFLHLSTMDHVGRSIDEPLVMTGPLETAPTVC